VIMYAVRLPIYNLQGGTITTFLIESPVQKCPKLDIKDTSADDDCCGLARPIRVITKEVVNRQLAQVISSAP